MLFEVLYKESLHLSRKVDSGNTKMTLYYNHSKANCKQCIIPWLVSMYTHFSCIYTLFWLLLLLFIFIFT